MRFKIYILIAVALTVSSAIYFKIVFLKPDTSDKNMSEVVNLNTKDGFEIIGDYYEADSDKGVLLLHMMPADRKSWIQFAEKVPCYA